MNDTTERFIIGESGQAGLPITAPIGEVASLPIRWRYTGKSFVLEYWLEPQGVHSPGSLQTGEWREVPCVSSEKEKL